MQVEKVTAHNHTDKEIAREKKDAKQSEAEMKANVAKAEHRAQKEESVQTGHARNGATNFGGGTVGTTGAYDAAPTGRTGRDYV